MILINFISLSKSDIGARILTSVLFIVSGYYVFPNILAQYHDNIHIFMLNKYKPYIWTDQYSLFELA